MFVWNHIYAFGNLTWSLQSQGFVADSDWGGWIYLPHLINHPNRFQVHFSSPSSLNYFSVHPLEVFMLIHEFHAFQLRFPRQTWSLAGFISLKDWERLQYSPAFLSWRKDSVWESGFAICLWWRFRCLVWVGCWLILRSRHPKSGCEVVFPCSEACLNIIK